MRWILVMLAATGVFGQIVTTLEMDGFTVDRGAAHGVKVGFTGMIETDIQLGERVEALRFATFEVYRVGEKTCRCKVTDIQPGQAVTPGQRVIFDQELISAPPAERDQTTTVPEKAETRKPTSPDPSRMSVVERIDYARDLINRGNYEKAVEVFDALKSEVPDDAPFRSDHSRAKRLLDQKRQSAREQADRRAQERAERQRVQDELAEIRKNLDYYRVLVETYKSSDLDKAIEYQEQICRVDSSEKARNLRDDLQYERAKRRLPDDFESDDIESLRRDYPRRSRELVDQAARHEEKRAERDRAEAERKAREESERRRREAEAEAARKATLTEALVPMLTQKGRSHFGTAKKGDLSKNDDHPASRLATGFPLAMRPLKLNTIVDGKSTAIIVNGNVVLKGSLNQPKAELEIDLGSYGRLAGIELSASIQAEAGKQRTYFLVGRSTSLEGFELEVGGELWIRDKKDEFGAGGILDLTVKRDRALEEERWKSMSEPALTRILPAGTPGHFFLPNGQTIHMRWIPAGSFQMGSPSHESGRDNDEVQHRVTLSRGYWMLETEVTQSLWEAVMGSNPSRFKGSNRPVESVSWNEVQMFIGKLNGMGQGTFRLPTEAEWENACRAGTTGAYAGSLDAMGWYDGNSRGETHGVGQKQANAWGLYDMHGNVWEWCQDWYGDYSSGSVTDPKGPSGGSGRVFRGGGWSSCARDCRSAFRLRYTPGHRGNYLGFRLARSPE